MYSDTDPIFHELPGRTIKVYAVSDVHIGAAECDLEGFRAFLRRVCDEPDAYLVICGDLVDNAVQGGVASVYGSRPHEQIEQAVEALAPIAPKILGVISGNHEARTLKAADIDPCEIVCCRLGIERVYRRNMAFVRVKLQGEGSVCDVHNLLLMHGASDAKRRKLHVEGVDALVTGHTHAPMVEKPARLVLTQKGAVQVRPMVHLVACSWLGYGGYSAAKMYDPKATSDPQHLVLEFVSHNRRRGGISVVW